ncbi:hypothetical protein AC578_9387 [Pseudocercospora eumusae]|uniref:non-specific serine/threonine protein kinase n=1 Tax=Pseudocercospora eumusae TaxID=321146 RepID=A0A139H6P9_9PEZI|nr:hypothetical protein AC578_9387 [Pseudocercospora eumusae]
MPPKSRTRKKRKAAEPDEPDEPDEPPPPPPPRPKRAKTKRGGRSGDNASADNAQGPLEGEEERPGLSETDSVAKLDGEDRAQRLGLRGVGTDPKAEWQWVRSLGTGGVGHAGLWKRVDENGELIDRIVAKESSPEFFMSRDLWYDEPLKTPKEAALMESINQMRDSKNVLRCLGWRVYKVLKIIRLYLEYCEHGDLENLIEIYDRKRGSSTDHYLPVRAIWAIFESLVAALCLLHRGGMPGHSLPPKWKPMVHQDIKPHNIFMTKPDEVIWKQIPTPKLADFGTATQDTFIIPGGGTKGYRAPEQYDYEDPDNEDSDNAMSNVDITTKSDIWAAGRTILVLMNLTKDTDIKEHRFGSGNILPEYRDVATENYYPDELKDLVERCLRDKPEERPDVVELWNSIQTHVGTPISRGALPMRQAQRPFDEEPLELPGTGKDHGWGI